MIFGAHLILFSTDADADRAFLSTVLDLDSVDAGGGWLIFKLPPAEAAVHPDETPGAGLYLMCDDLEADMQVARRPRCDLRAGRRGALGIGHDDSSPRRRSGRPVPAAPSLGHRYEQLTEPVPTNARSRPLVLQGFAGT